MHTPREGLGRHTVLSQASAHGHAQLKPKKFGGGPLHGEPARTFKSPPGKRPPVRDAPVSLTVHDECSLYQAALSEKSACTQVIVTSQLLRIMKEFISETWGYNQVQSVNQQTPSFTVGVRQA